MAQTRGRDVLSWDSPIVQDLIQRGYIAASDVPQGAKNRKSPLPPSLTPQQVLFEQCVAIWGDLEVLSNWKGLLPEHKHEIDIYFASQRWGIEVQSEQFHGNKHYGPRKMYEDCEKSQLYGLIGVSLYYVMSNTITHNLYGVLEWVKHMRHLRHPAR